jgi:hypothetical protein
VYLAAVPGDELLPQELKGGGLVPLVADHT